MRNLELQARNLHTKVITLRHELHQHPELAFEEQQTARVVAQALTGLGLDVQTGVGKTGVMGLLEGSEPGPTVMVRCDMDALPIDEQSSAAYVSQTPGKMHACGHDGHTAIALGVAEILAQHRAAMHGRVKFVFQPAEETGQGALAMIDDGVLSNPSPDVCLGLHLWNELPVGEVAVTPGPIMAGADSFYVTIEGRGGHGALPHLTADPVLAMAHSVTALQSIVSRNVSPLATAVISTTQVQAGSAVNIIPDTCRFSGTIRTFDPVVRQRVLDRIEAIIGGTAATLGCRAHVEFELMSLPVINNEHVAARVGARAVQILPGLTYHRDFRTMAAEDVAYFLTKVPGLFMLVGSANAARKLNYPHHHPSFDFDEDALLNGMILMAAGVGEFVLQD
jgi:amidohydrolase